MDVLVLLVEYLRESLFCDNGSFNFLLTACSSDWVLFYVVSIVRLLVVAAALMDIVCDCTLGCCVVLALLDVVVCFV